MYSSTLYLYPPFSCTFENRDRNTFGTSLNLYDFTTQHTYMCQFASEGLGVNWVSALLRSKRLALSALIHHALLFFFSFVSSSASSPSYLFRLCFVSFSLALFVRLIFVSFIENRCKVISNDGRLAQGFCSYSWQKKKRSWDPPSWDQQDAS